MSKVQKNLVIVESPAKSKTITKYLWAWFEVLASYGHVSDLVKKNMGIDIENDFAPKYEISPEKARVIKELRAAAKKADKVWIATDEDREWEAIGWHVANALGLDVKTTARIVFHEITKDALQHAVKNPRTLDMNLVDAQQARRILDRLVWFELSPVLWKKIKGWLSAGRVQSVAVRIIVEREREIHAHESSSTFKVVAALESNKKKFKAEVPKNYAKEESARAFLEAAQVSTLTVKSLETKPSKKTPTAPFTTSTLQQEASRKMWFAVGQTMRVAQKLYEAWHITYMRTDSVNISDTASKAAEAEIIKRYGKEYAKPTAYKGKSAWAQEAHECIRPTHMWVELAWENSQEKRLYDLIRKRLISSQMAAAQLEKTKAVIDVSLAKEDLVANGEVIRFDGFLKVYMEWKDDEHGDEEGWDDESAMLPAMEKWQILKLWVTTATETFDRHKPRYTEASLVKKLEQEGIWRPSTYAPTIATVQKRGYVVLDDRPGKERETKIITLKSGKITHEVVKKIYGAEKKKLFPTDMWMLVNDFLVENFADIVDYHFTAQVEEEFDHIAHGKLKWQKMIKKFYDPFIKEVSKAVDHAERVTGERELWTDPKTWKPVIARMWRYWPLVQIGGQEDEEKKFAKVRPGLSIEDITLEEALDCFALPKHLGEYEWKEIQSNIGRFGPYLRRWTVFVSIKPTEEFPDDDPYKIEHERAVELLKAKIKADKEKVINEFEHEWEKIIVENWRRGPFVRFGKKNLKLPKEMKDKPEKITLKQILKLAKEQK